MSTEALILRRFMPNIERLNEMHVRILLPRRNARPIVHETASGVSGAALQKIECQMGQRQAIGISADAVVPSEREERETDVIEIKAVIEDGAVPVEPARPALVGSEPSRTDQEFYALPARLGRVDQTRIMGVAKNVYLSRLHSGSGEAGVDG